MDQLKAMRYLLAVAGTGSFTAAARQLGVPPSSVSRRVSELEARLGAELVLRTTRTVSLTEVGTQYCRDAEKLLHQLALADDAVRDYQSAPQGVLKVNALVGFGERILLPLLERFVEQHPRVRLDVTLTDELSKPGSEDVDLAIRGGFAPDERVMAVRLLDNDFVAVASPDYLRRHGRPQSTRELASHSGLFYKTPVGPTPWLSEIDGRWQNVSAPAYAVSNNGAWLIRLAIAAKGILLMPQWAVQDALDSAALLLLDFPEPLVVTPDPGNAVYLLYQKQRYRIPKVKAAVDFLCRTLQSKAPV
ncbi:LysR family transcriptional regulator [Granulosicoccaceae sp. 1_MG-2023]|nr:LysR family transcriptional regulator [Granulosicoccaceae sp. 1_MG-2023]